MSAVSAKRSVPAMTPRIAAILAAAVIVLPAITVTAAESRLGGPVSETAPAPILDGMRASVPTTPVVSAPSVAAPATALAPEASLATPATAPTPPVVAPATAASAPIGWAATRLLLACGAVGVLLIGGLKLYRRSLQPGARASRRRGSSWLARWVPANASDADKITLLARNYLGARESVCVLRVGTERFLVGVTAAQISMIARLSDRASLGGDRASLGDEGTSTGPTRATHELRRGAMPHGDASAVDPAPATPDFSETLMAAASAREGGGDAELRASLARSRDRLARLVAGRSPGA